jgi:hypothetical protein
VNIPFRTGKPMRGISFEASAGAADRRTGQPEWSAALGVALQPLKQAADSTARQTVPLEVPA